MVQVTLLHLGGRVQTHILEAYCLLEPSIQLTWSVLPPHQRPRVEGNRIISGVTDDVLGYVYPLTHMPEVVREPTHF